MIFYETVCNKSQTKLTYDLIYRNELIQAGAELGLGQLKLELGYTLTNMIIKKYLD